MELISIIIKIVVVTTIVTLPLLIVLVKSLRRGNLMIPSSSILFTSALLPVAYLLSAIFAVDKNTAVLGYGFNTDSLIVTTLGFLSLSLTVLLSVKKATADKIKKFVMGVSVFVFVLFILQILLNVLSLSIVSWLAPFMPVRTWIDVASMIGLMVVMILSVNKQLVDKGKLKHSLYITIVVFTLIFMGVFTNINNIFVVLFLFSIFKLWQVMVHKNDEGHFVFAFNFKNSLTFLPLVVLVLSGLFIVDNTLINARVSNTLQGWSKVSFVDVRPNWQGTLTVAKGSIGTSDITTKLFGQGSGSFNNLWRVYKPTTVNITRFWGANFNSAVGLVPTSVITGGIVVLVGWLVFLLVLLLAVLRNRNSVFALPTLFVWVFMIFNPVGTLVFLIGFVVTGLFVSDLTRARTVKVINYKLRGEGKNRLLVFILLPVVGVASVGSLAVVGHRAVVDLFISQASTSALNGKVDKAEQLLDKVRGLANSAEVERGYTRVAITKLATLLKADKNKKDSKIDQKTLQGALSNVLTHAKLAIEKDPTNPTNYMILGDISEQLMALKIRGAGESALAAYTKALELDPKNPFIPLAIARVNGVLGDKEQMTKALEASLRLKPNYEPALYQYGLLKLSEQDAKTAIRALGAVVQIDQNNANALYYLSLALIQEGRLQEALVVMQRVVVLNPDNKDVRKLVDSLKARIGKSTSKAEIKSTEATTTKKLESTQ